MQSALPHPAQAMHDPHHNASMNRMLLHHNSLIFDRTPSNDLKACTRSTSKQCTAAQLAATGQSPQGTHRALLKHGHPVGPANGGHVKSIVATSHVDELAVAIETASTESEWLQQKSYYAPCKKSSKHSPHCLNRLHQYL